MAVINWDANGRLFEAGLDRAVLYTPGNPGVAWSGLISVDDSKSEMEETSYYFDGIKYASQRAEGEYNAKITAFTYPDEFAPYEGIADYAPGFSLGNQPNYATFGLTFRTLVGNGILGLGLGYKIHVLYNLYATPNDHAHQTLSDENDLDEFSWNISAVPETVPGFRPTAHLIFDSRKLTSAFMLSLEQILYGTSVTNPRLPSIMQLMTLHTSGLTRVDDYGNGIFLVEGPDANVYQPDADTIIINAAGVTPLGDGVYQISDGEE